MKIFPPIRSFFVASVIAVPALAQVNRTEDLDGLHVSTWVWIGVFSLLGWIAADLPKLAGWVDPTPDRELLWRKRLEVIQGVGASFLAGLSVFFLCKASPKMVWLESTPPEMTVFVFVGIAGFIGVRALQAIQAKFFK